MNASRITLDDIPGAWCMTRARAWRQRPTLSL